MTDRKITILGINGHVGHAAAKAFVAAGWDVTGFGRADRRPVAGVRFVEGDAERVEDMRKAIGDSAVVLDALNLPYHQWDKGRAEAQQAAVVEAMGSSGRTLLFPGNIYNYAATDRIVTPDLVQHPETPRGAIRVRVEQALAAAARKGGLQVIVLRAGDFYAGDNSGDWFDLVMLREASKQRLALLGTPGVGHSWAYLPDLARAFEVLARRRGEFGAFETFHFAGHDATPEQMAAAIAAAAPVPLKTSRFPWTLLTVLGLFNPMMREVAKMGYLWRMPMALRDERLDALLGPGFDTPFGEAVAATVARFFPRASRSPAVGGPLPASSLHRAGS